MSLYSNPTSEDISEIMAEFMDHEISSYTLLRGGSQNTNYRIETASDKYVLTICEEKSVEETEKLVHLLEHLADHNFPTSKVIRTKEDKPITIWNGKPIMLKAYLKGKILESIPLSLLRLCGRQLAQLHQIPAPKYIPKDLCFGLNQFDEVKLYADSSEFHHWLNQITKLVKEHLSPDLSKSLIHSDVFFSNVIISPDENDATIMDFEEACYYYRIFDLGMMIIGLCSKDGMIDLDSAKQIVSCYQSLNALLPIEKESLQAFTVYAAAATGFWRHKQFNYTKYDEDQKDRYLEMQAVATYIEGIEVNEFKALLS